MNRRLLTVQIGSRESAVDIHQVELLKTGILPQKLTKSSREALKRINPKTVSQKLNNQRIRVKVKKLRIRIKAKKLRIRVKVTMKVTYRNQKGPQLALKRLRTILER